MRPVKIVGKVVGVMVVIALASLLFGKLVQVLWNNLLPDIFHGSVMAITFWQAVGLLVLARILFFRGFGHHRKWGRHHGWGGPWAHHGGPWGYGGPWGGMKEQWENMTPEERQKMKDEMKQGWRQWKEKWHDMTPEDKDRMKAAWKERCHNWRTMHPADILAREEEERQRQQPGPAGDMPNA